MPLYEFTCLDCNRTFEQICSMKDCEDKNIRCPECGSAKVRKLLSTVNLAGSKGSLAPLSSGKGCGGGSGFS